MGNFWRYTYICSQMYNLKQKNHYFKLPNKLEFVTQLFVFTSIYLQCNLHKYAIGKKRDRTTMKIFASVISIVI
jgi:hypothetical protein